jgi:hypothetical protein
MNIDSKIHMLRSYARMSKNDGQGRSKVDIAIETILDRLEEQEKEILELKEYKYMYQDLCK